jgi:hypothetical protein
MDVVEKTPDVIDEEHEATDLALGRGDLLDDFVVTACQAEDLVADGAEAAACCSHGAVAWEGEAWEDDDDGSFCSSAEDERAIRCGLPPPRISAWR